MTHRPAAGGGLRPAMRRTDHGPGRLRLIVAVLALGASLLVGSAARPVAAQSTEVTSAEAADLARAAAESEAAQADLLAVERVDGRPVDLGPVIVDRGPGQAERLRVLADAFDEASTAPSAATPGASDDARAQAEAVLDDDKFQQADVPKPFKGLLEWMADRIRPVGDFFGRLFDPILALPGGPFILGGLFFAAAGLAAGWLVGRRSRAVLSRAGGGALLVDGNADPDDLDRRAGDAEASGAYREAVRLSYQAGLLRLARAGRLSLRTDTTAAEAARQVDEDAMWRLTDDFEQIVYGDRAAIARDAEEARQQWSSLLAARVDR